MNKDLIDISVIMPMYNVESLIAETINSLKDNSSNIEFLLIDDGSIDATFENAKKAIADDHRFKLVRQKHQGVSVARNHGLELAKGIYITFVDSDDLLPPHALDVMLETAFKQDADFVCGGVKKFNSQKQWYIDAHIRHNVFKEGAKNILDNPELVFFIGIAGKLIHNKLLKGLSFPVGMKFSEDTVVIYQCFLNAKKIYTISDVVYLYRERDLESYQASATQQKDEKAFIYFKDTLKTVLICKEKIINTEFSEENKYLILKKYYDRFFSYEIWPIFVKILINDKKNINKSFRLFLDFLKNHTKDEINKIAAIRFFLVKILIDKIYLLSIKNFFAYRELLQYLFESLDSEISAYCKKPNVYGQKWDDSYKIAYQRKDKALLYFNLLIVKKGVFYKIKHDPNFIKKQLFPKLIKLPVNQNKVVFATHRKKPMSSNFNAVFDELKKDESLEIYKFLGKTNSVKTLLKRYYHLATAKNIFLEDYYKPIYGLTFNPDTNIVQLWHACGAFKKFSFAAIGLEDSHSFEFEGNAHAAYTHIISSSQFLLENYAESFNHKINNIHAVGIPRTDLFFDTEMRYKMKNRVLDKYLDLELSTNILYAPTFRGNPSVRHKFYLNLDWNVIFEKLPDNTKLLIKLHPAVKEIYPPIPDFIKDKVLLLSTNESVEDLMVFCDVLITDYSSLIFEYSLLNKPIIFYPYDLDKYFNERGFYYAYDDYVYGDVVSNTKDLMEAIIQANYKLDEYAEKRHNFINKFMSNCDGYSTNRLLDLLGLSKSKADKNFLLKETDVISSVYSNQELIFIDDNQLYFELDFVNIIDGFLYIRGNAFVKGIECRNYNSSYKYALKLKDKTGCSIYIQLGKDSDPFISKKVVDDKPLSYNKSKFTTLKNMGIDLRSIPLGTYEIYVVVYIDDREEVVSLYDYSFQESKFKAQGSEQLIYRELNKLILKV